MNNIGVCTPNGGPNGPHGGNQPFSCGPGGGPSRVQVADQRRPLPIVRTIDALPSTELPALAHVSVELPDRGITLHGVALLAVARAPAGVAVICPRHRVRDGHWQTSVMFADRAEYLALVNACRRAWLERADKGWSS
jgi:hypothetical protein